MRCMFHRVLLSITLLALLLTCASCTPSWLCWECVEVKNLPPRNTVVWISIDGLRHDYLARAKPPTLTKLAAEGLYTNQETPIFPSLTFPNHAAQVTGRYVDGHGIPANAFFDSDTNQTYYLPDDAFLYRAEPIWITAKKQGVRSAVINWPMSHKQTGPVTADYFEPTYNKKQTDAERLDHIIDLLKTDKTDQPVRLVLTYLFQLDYAGHEYGPDTPQVDAALLNVDRLLAKFQADLTTWFDATHTSRDELVLLITTDHGMETIRESVNLDRLLGGDLLAGAKLVPSGPIASIYLTGVAPEAKPARVAAIVNQLRQNDLCTAWPATDVPANYHFADPTRVGDVTVLLKPGYVFTPLRVSATQPVKILKGNHGFDPAVSPNMLGSAIVWRYRHPFDHRDLGPVDNTQWHATVAKLLCIQPAKDADPRAIPLGP